MSAQPFRVFAVLCAGWLLVACTEEPGATPTFDVSGSDLGPSQDPGGTGGQPDVSDAEALVDEGTPADEGAPPDQASPSCLHATDCDDGLSCTTDACEDGVCTWALIEEACLIGKVCFASGDAHKDDACRVCAPADDPFAWHARPDGAKCEAGDACLTETTCQVGLCVGAAVECKDDSACTTDSCDPAVGCVFEAKPNGALCVIFGDDCIAQAACQDGLCAPILVVCDDGNGCTNDACLDGACAFVAAFGQACDDGEPCTTGDQCDAQGGCAGGPAETCDDDNPCTLDQCVPTIGCANLPTETPCCLGETSICDDANACTNDLCDPVTLECAYENVAGTPDCDDGQQCTTSDACAEGVCVGAKSACDDGNPCTEDSCSEANGCGYLSLSLVACDDGLECSTGGECVNGACVADTTACACPIDPQHDAVKVNSLQLGTGGKPGEGLDVDKNPDTCAPSANCDGGIDNAFGSFAALANSGLADAVAGGDLVLILQAPVEKNGTFTVAIHQGEPVDGGCDFQADTCDYLVEDAGFNADTCAALFTFEATLDGSTLSGGGPGAQLPFALPIQDGVVLEVVVFNLQILAEVVTDGGQITSADGLLGGAIRKSALIAAIEALDPSSLPAGISKEVIITILGTLDYSIDTTGDGQGDAASIGFKFHAIDAAITGVQM